MNLQERMLKSLDSFKEHLSTIRAGRANPDMLSKIQVEYYGSMVPIQQVATISIPEPMSFVLNVFDKNAIKNVEKAILKADLNVNPQIDGGVIRINLPELTEERRKEYVKLVKKNAEETKISIRNIRRDYLEHIKHQEKEKEITEDDVKTEHSFAQKETDKFMEKVNVLVSKKEAEIMEV